MSQVFSVANSGAVEVAARRLDRRLADQRWLTLSNRYLTQAPTVIRADLPREDESLLHLAGSEEADQLAEYVAASSILHCSDGWSYLGRAMAAQLRGDVGAARHLAYYAELRGALSLLAAQGVGVFSGIHVTLSASGDVELFRHWGTHRFAWEALSAWTDLKRSTELFGKIIQPADAPLADWLDPLIGADISSATGRQYLREWGLDVERFGLDRDARNDSSYQPRTILGAAVPSSSRAAEFSQDFWTVFEPTGGTSFGLLDGYLLRRILRSRYRAQTGHQATADPEGFGKLIDRALETVQPSESKEQIISFLQGQVLPDEPPLFSEAETHSAMDDSEDHLQVIARAGLFLRVSSGAARQLLEDAQLSYPDYEWWARQIAVTRALSVDTGSPLEPPETLWADIDLALESLTDKLADGNTATYIELNDRCAEELSVLGGCERIALWALAA
ncbi:MAG TPA: hypothetical protein VNN15_01155 [Solirubrobacterales bacterium]|nr:hypothetical protein [Solirubrobacterales bacterium]